MKLKLSVLVCSILLACVGCKNISPATQRAIETQAVAAGVVIGIQKAPTARPYIAAVTPIVCSEANGTNPSPAQIAAAIQAADPQGKTPEAILIVNGSLAIFSAVVDQLGTNTATMQNYALGLCDGLNEGLAFSPAPVTLAKRGIWPFRRKVIHRPAMPAHID